VLPSLDLLRVKIEAATLPRVANERRMVLFTAQEPSGDAHAAPVISRLRERYPEIEPVAWGGPKMEAAGATMLGRTADDGVWPPSYGQLVGLVHDSATPEDYVLTAAGGALLIAPLAYWANRLRARKFDRQDIAAAILRQQSLGN
jgi:hypothetical protein